MGVVLKKTYFSYTNMHPGPEIIKRTLDPICEYTAVASTIYAHQGSCIFLTNSGKALQNGGCCNSIPNTLL